MFAIILFLALSAPAPLPKSEKPRIVDGNNIIGVWAITINDTNDRIVRFNRDGTFNMVWPGCLFTYFGAYHWNQDTGVLQMDFIAYNGRYYESTYGWNMQFNKGGFKGKEIWKFGSPCELIPARWPDD